MNLDMIAMPNNSRAGIDVKKQGSEGMKSFFFSLQFYPITIERITCVA
jgi:hypothetical protein